MHSVSPLGRFIKSSKIAERRAIGDSSILRRSAKCTRQPNLEAARKKTESSPKAQLLKVAWVLHQTGNWLHLAREIARLVSPRCYPYTDVGGPN